MRNIYKVIIAGEGGVGKTTLLHRYIHDIFVEDSQMTLGVEFFRKNIKIGEISNDIVIWDFGGQERFRELLTAYAAGLHGAMLIFDLSNIRRSLRNLDFWWNLLNKWGKVPIILIGTKSDLVSDKQISLYKHLITEALDKYEFADYIETSSKLSFNVQEAFEILVDKIIMLSSIKL